jgi:hypothetical protein
LISFWPNSRRPNSKPLWVGIRLGSKPRGEFDQVDSKAVVETGLIDSGGPPTGKLETCWQDSRGNTCESGQDLKEIHAEFAELSKALEQNISFLKGFKDGLEGMRSGSDSLLEKTIQNIATELKDNREQLATLRRVFSNDTALAFSNKYESEDVKPLHGGNARGGCMNAVYEGLEVLFGLGDEFSERLQPLPSHREKHGWEEGTHR